MTLLRIISDIADMAVLLPVALLALAGLLLAGWRRAAASWGVVLSLGFALVAAAKLLTLGCPQIVPGRWNLHSPSLHVAGAALVFGGLAALVVEPRRRRWVGLLAGLAMALAVGNSRLQLVMETPADLLTGGALGLAALWELTGLIGPRPLQVRPPWAMAVLALCLAALLNGAHMDVQARIDDLAGQVAALGVCPEG